MKGLNICTVGNGNCVNKIIYKHTISTFISYFFYNVTTRFVFGEIQNGISLDPFLGPCMSSLTFFIIVKYC